MRHTDGTADDQVTDGLVARLAALDDCLHGVDPDPTTLSDGTHAAVGLSHPQLGDAIDAILKLRQAAAASRRTARDGEAPLPSQIGRFEVVRLAGSGGFACVAEAIDPTLNRRVALKVPRPEAILTPGLRRRFLREAEIAARLSHPHIVTIHEVGEADGLAYIAQEFCAGGSLADWLEDHPGPLPPRIAVHLVMTLARAIAYAHGEGVIHRDIKPANILLVPARPGDPAVLPPDLIVKLGDFGLGKASGAAEEQGVAQLTQTGARVGTPTWMAPEQVDATIGPVGPWSDIHALGILLDRLLTGRCLRGGRTDAETFRQILLDDPVACDRVQPGLSRDLGAVCLKCLARNPRDRYASAGDVAGDLQRFLEGQPTVARPLSPAARIARGIRRRPLATSLAGLALAAIVFAGWASGERSREFARHAATAADMRRHEAATALRRGFDALRTGNAAAALGHLEACRRIDSGLADSFAGRWLERRLHGEETLLLPQGGSTDASLHDVSISPDGTLFAAGAADGTLLIGSLDGASPTQRVRSARAHDEINGVAFSPD
ncbi:MAG: protein kinase domain-containing protein, partial [Planctomycetia bacterium]